MKHYVGLDVSMEETSVCILDEAGEMVYTGKVSSTPEAIAALVGKRSPDAVRVVLETGPLSTWHWHELRALGVPVICLDARHAQAVLSCQVNKTDTNDALGLARLAHSGWYREVRVKSMQSHHVRSLLSARGQLVKMRRDLENQIRGLLKTFGLLIGKVAVGRYEARVQALLAEAPALEDVIGPLLSARRTVLREVEGFNKRVLALARDSAACRHLMQCPSIGPVTALAYNAMIDNPARFKKSSSVGAYIGLTARRYQSGEIDRAGRISKCGDAMVRSLLYEAANVLLTRVKKSCPLKTWGLRLMKRIGARKAKVAVARKLAVIMHRMLVDGADFRWSNTSSNGEAVS